MIASQFHHLGPTRDNHRSSKFIYRHSSHLWWRQRHLRLQVIISHRRRRRWLQRPTWHRWIHGRKIPSTKISGEWISIQIDCRWHSKKLCIFDRWSQRLNSRVFQSEFISKKMLRNENFASYVSAQNSVFSVHEVFHVDYVKGLSARNATQKCEFLLNISATFQFNCSRHHSKILQQFQQHHRRVIIIIIMELTNHFRNR